MIQVIFKNLIAAQALPVLNTYLSNKKYTTSVTPTKMKLKLWNNLEYKLDTSIILADLLIEKYINLFWKDVMETVEDNQYMLLLLRVKYTNGNFSTIGTLQKINITCKEQLIKDYKNLLSISFEAYKDLPISSIIFSYGIRKGVITPNISSQEYLELNKYHIYYNNKLPIAMLPEEYGLVLSNVSNVYTIMTENNATIILTINPLEKEGNIVNSIKYFKDKKLLFSWIDTITSLEDKKFIRRIGKSILYYENMELVLYSTIKKTKPIVPKILPKDTNSGLNNKFITMDLETININNTLIPYLLCWYDGTVKRSYFLSNPENLHDLENFNRNDVDASILSLLQDAMIDICIRKYKNYKIYLHNFSKFDGYFLVRNLAQLGITKPIIHKGRIISCKFNLFESNYPVTFMDSYLILPHSLKDLSYSFNIDSPKGIFPIKLNNINYQGVVPDFKNFNNISIEEYSNYSRGEQFKNKIWNFKEEAVKYCELDCIALFQILSKFNELIFYKFNLNIIKYPTLPSLAFNLFITHYLKKDSVHMLSGEIANDIRLSYTGGSVDMYISKNLLKEPIYVYDVNSLYPYVMANNKFPVGSPTYFEGDITKTEHNPFGFFYCKIIAPDNLLHPILQTHHNSRTISPLGKWEGMYFSEELYNAEKYGYKFKVLWGYTFNSSFIFKDYINDFYDMRLTNPKTDPMNLTAKLLLNSLYGRFGMNDNFDTLEIIKEKDLREMEQEKGININQIISLGGNYIVGYNYPRDELITNIQGDREIHNISIPIAASVTANARIYMSKFKNNPLFPNLYYTDTDSLYFDGPLPDEFVDPKRLGALKLEGIWDRALFLAPKVYALINDETGETTIKIKGLTKDAIKRNNITFELLATLLSEDYKLSFNQNKWFRSFNNAKIQILDQTYNLKVTGNKRELIYKDNQLIGTKSFILNN